jgi:integrase
MPVARDTIPRLQHHRASGQARVRLAGRDLYLGPYGTPEARERYDRLIAEWLAAGRQIPRAIEQPSASSAPLVNDVLMRFLTWAQEYYGVNDRSAKEYVNLTHAMRPLRDLYGRTPAGEFGPRALKAVRQHMLDVQQLCRAEINKRVGRIKRVFKWAVAEELIPSHVYEALRAVDGLRRGRTPARENAPVRPVEDAHVNAILPFVSPQVAAMIQLQRLTGMRPGEVVQMRLCDLDRSGPVWGYRPASHKTDYLGHGKLIPLGPRAQAILQPFLERPAEAPLFSPQEAEDWRHERRAQQRRPDRKTKVYPCELRAREQRRQAARRRISRRPKREAFDVDSYRRAITYGLRQARRQQPDLPHWHPHQLRHSRGTEVRKRYGVEAAQVALGHARMEVTEIYAERNQQLAEQIAQETG